MIFINPFIDVGVDIDAQERGKGSEEPPKQARYLGI